MKLNLQRGQLITLVKWIVSLNIIFLAGTFLFHTYYYRILGQNWETGTNIKYLLVEFSLANENVLATWYSSVLLLFVGIVFWICYMIQKKGSTKRNEKYLSYGWLIFAGIFVLLSLDEMASLHERLGNIATLNPMGDDAPGWVVLLAGPIFLVSCFMLWFCLLQAKRAPRAAIFAVVGILLFGSIPVQEYFELNAWQGVDYSETWKRPVSLLLMEEGSEIFGATSMMIAGFLFAFKSAGAGMNTDQEKSLTVNFRFNKRNTIIQYAAGSLLLGFVMLTLLKLNIFSFKGEITDLGRRENWFPTATAFISSLLCLYLHSNAKSSNVNLKNIFLYLSIFCLAISAYYGGNIHAYMYKPMESFFKISIVAFISLITLCLAVKMFISVKDLYTRILILLWACFLIPAFGIFSWHSAALVYLGFTLLFGSLLHMITSVVPINVTTPVTDETIV